MRDSGGAHGRPLAAGHCTGIREEDSDPQALDARRTPYIPGVSAGHV